MGQQGLNFPADMRLAPQFGHMLKAQWLRVVLKPEYDLTPWIADAHRLGLNVLGVVARESITDGDPFIEWADAYHERYGDSLEAIQCGNESDHESPSSWTMTPAELNDLLAAFNARFQDTTIVGPGMVSGDPHYLDAVDLDLLDGIAVHPYGQRPDNGDWSELPGNFGAVGRLLDSYRYHGKDIWVTEIGVSTTECSPEFQARYCEAMLKALSLRKDVPVVCWFASDDLMVPEFGLFDVNGKPKPAAAAFMRVAKETEPVNLPKFQLGFKTVAQANPILVGGPLEDEFGFVDGISLQRTENGILFWADTRASGSHMGFIDLRTGDRYRWNPSAGLVRVAA